MTSVTKLEAARQLFQQATQTQVLQQGLAAYDADPNFTVSPESRAFIAQVMGVDLNDAAPSAEDISAPAEILADNLASRITTCCQDKKLLHADTQTVHEAFELVTGLFGTLNQINPLLTPTLNNSLRPLFLMLLSSEGGEKLETVCRIVKTRYGAIGISKMELQSYIDSAIQRDSGDQNRAENALGQSDLIDRIRSGASWDLDEYRRHQYATIERNSAKKDIGTLTTLKASI